MKFDCTEPITDRRYVALELYCVDGVGGAGTRNAPFEIAAVEVIGNENTGKTFHTYLNPHLPLYDVVSKATGITDEKLVNAPCFAYIIGDLIDFIGDAQIVTLNKEYLIRPLEEELIMAERSSNTWYGYCYEIIDISVINEFLKKVGKTEAIDAYHPPLAG